MKRLAPLPGQVSSSTAPNRTCEFPRWRVTAENYLGRVTKPRILEAVREARGEDSEALPDFLFGDEGDDPSMEEAGGYAPEILAAE
jgi:hypothetical protein